MGSRARAFQHDTEAASQRNPAAFLNSGDILPFRGDALIGSPKYFGVRPRFSEPAVKAATSWARRPQVLPCEKRGMTLA